MPAFRGPVIVVTLIRVGSVAAVSVMAEDMMLKMGYIVHYSKEYVSVVHCNDIFDVEAVVKTFAFS